ncbi:MAG: carboxylate-amine ligase [Phormidesmis sp.]
MSQAEASTLGVEEEYQVIDPATRELSSQASQIIQAKATPGDEENPIQPEMHRCQVEIATDVCQTLADVRAALTQARRNVIEAAKENNSVIIAAGTHPFSSWRDQQVTDKARYYELADTLKQLIRELIIYGCHVHVGLADREAAVQVVNRARLHLPVLLALSANSPYWMGAATGYDSYRMEQWCRLPAAGPPPLFEDYDEHEATIEQLVNYEIVDEPTKIYWDIRLSKRFPTIEFRVADVCATVDEAVLQAGLCRAIAQTAYSDAQSNKPYPKVRTSLLRAAMWQAARHGLSGHLIDFDAQQPRPAATVVNALLQSLRPALEQNGDWEEVSTLLNNVLQNGNAAQRQQQVYAQTNSYESVVDFLIQETEKGCTVA